jgi:hypothetical protein
MCWLMEEALLTLSDCSIFDKNIERCNNQLASNETLH